MKVWQAMARYQEATIGWCKAMASDCKAAEEFYDNVIGLYRHQLVEALIKSDPMSGAPAMTEEGAHSMIDGFSDWIIEQGEQATVVDWIQAF